MWDFRGILHEDGINIALAHLRMQRPSLFNSATTKIATDQSLLCTPIPDPPNGAPKVEIVEPIVLEKDKWDYILVDYCQQITNISMDFYPGGSLTDNQFLFRLGGCLGIGLPDSIPDTLLRFPRGAENPPATPNEVYLSFTRLICHCTEVSATGIARWITKGTKSFLFLQVGELSIDGISDPGLRELITSNLKTKLNLKILPGASLILEKIQIEVSKAQVEFRLVPYSHGTNPTISNNQLSAFLSFN